MTRQRSAPVGCYICTVLVLALIIGGCSTTSGFESGESQLSTSARAAAEGLGGKPRQGQTVFVIVGASADSEREAQALLDAATPTFGDMQTYFVVQSTASLKGLHGSRFVVIEAYEEEANAVAGLDLASRGFEQPEVLKVTVLTDDPIPVYEERTQ